MPTTEFLEKFSDNLFPVYKAFEAKGLRYKFILLRDDKLNAFAEIGENLPPFINKLTKVEIKKLLDSSPEKIKAFAGFGKNLLPFINEVNEYQIRELLDSSPEKIKAFAGFGKNLLPFINEMNEYEIREFLDSSPEKIKAFAGFEKNLLPVYKAFEAKGLRYKFILLEADKVNVLAEIGENLLPFINEVNEYEIRELLDSSPEKIKAFAGFDKKNSDKEISQPSGEIEIKDSEIKVDLGKNNNRHNDFGK